jgi:ureidoacrylate peracid hydrolase
MSVPWKIERGRSVLLVIDMQNDFLEEGAVLEVPMARDCIPVIGRLATACRALRVPVVYTAHIHYPNVSDSPLELLYFPELKERGLREGTPGAEICEALAPAPGEIVVKKHRYDAFYNTALDSVIRNYKGYQSMDTVIVTGTVTNICCESTARSAFMRDYKVVFVEDACGGLDAASHEATAKIIGLAFGRVLRADALLQILAEGE